MPINSPLPTDTRSKLADWIEIAALGLPRRTATRADLLGLFDLLDDADEHTLETDEVTGEKLETEILEDDRALFVDNVLDELEFRLGALADHYPFEIQVRGQQWSITLKSAVVSNEDAAARDCYIFCLLTSAIRDQFLSGTNLDPLKQAIAFQFQAISTEAAADVVGGEAISFGWPRPCGTAFQPMLFEVSKKLRLGKPLDAVPLWSKNREKDAGVDVIAWREFVDSRPGKLVLLGQVASGNNWTEKTVTSDIPGFMSWFSEIPTHHYIPAIFIPFPQHHDCQGRDNASFDDVAHAEAWQREREFGLVVDRLRIVGAAARNLLKTDAHRRTVLEGLNAWITQALHIARMAV